MRLSKIISTILDPIIKNKYYFILLFIITYVPIISYWIKNYCLFLKHYSLLALPVVFWQAYIMCLFTSMFKYKFRRILKIGILGLVSLLVFIETYIILYFGTRFNTSIVAMVFATNANEASGFLHQYVLSPFTFKYVLSVIAFIFLLIIIYKRKFYPKMINKLLHNNIIKVLLFIIATISILLGLYRTGRSVIWHKYNIDEIGRVRQYAFYSTNYLPISTLYDAIRLYFLSSRDLPVLINSLANTTIDECNYVSSNIVLIIGESFNKHHSSLYGYPLLTNPSLAIEPNLYVMNDAITTDGSTSIVMKNIFSFRTKNNNKYWAHSTLFPALFKKAGYNCTLFSNQEVENINFANVFDMANDYLVLHETKPFLWNVTNSSKYQYDMQLINEYADMFDQDNQYNLTIFHLLGQHAAYRDRYPEEFKYFTEDDYKFRTDLSLYQKRFVAEYDNAVRYGDFVLKSIIDLYRDDDAIIIFVSDHGEEIYDYRDYMGRSHEPIITADNAKYIFEVPFFIWVSDKYKQAHPDIVGRIENSINKPYVIDDVPHLLLDLAGIQCGEFEPSRSLISNERYDFPRLMHESMQDYDKLQ